MPKQGSRESWINLSNGVTCRLSAYSQHPLSDSLHSTLFLSLFIAEFIILLPPTHHSNFFCLAECTYQQSGTCKKPESCCHNCEQLSIRRNTKACKHARFHKARISISKRPAFPLPPLLLLLPVSKTSRIWKNGRRQIWQQILRRKRHKGNKFSVWNSNNTNTSVPSEILNRPTDVRDVF